MTDSIYYLVSMKLQGIGLKGLHDIFAAYGDPKAFLSALYLDSVSPSIPGWSIEKTKKTAGWYKEHREQLFEDAGDIIRKCEEEDIRILTPEDGIFPSICKIQPDLPLVLFCRGEADLLSDGHRRIGIIGARRCSRSGRDKCIQIASGEASSGRIVVSGMAKGIDAYAHTAAVKHRIKTIAVLGSGVDICYPNEHSGLLDEIIKHGLSVSQFFPGTTPRKYMFPIRNRLIAALSEELFVIDAGEKSGTASTIAAGNKYGVIINTL